MRRRPDPVADPDPGDPDERQHTAEDEQEITGHPQPLQYDVAGLGDIAQGAGLVVAVVDRVPQLQDAERQQGGEDHPGQTDVERPEGQLRQLLRPALRRDDVAQREQRQADGEHPVDAHHRAVRVVGGQRRADLVVGHDGQVDQEAENARADEVPEANGDKEHHRPPVRERCAAAGLLPGAQLQERPRLDGQERQRDDLHRGEERAQRHVLHRCAGEVQVVHCADDATHRVQDDVEEDELDGDLAAHHAQHHEDVGDHDRGEQLEEVLDPQVHHPEPPELGDGQMRLGAGEHADGVERGDGQAGVEEQPRHVQLALGLQPGPDRAVDDRHPQEQPDDEQNLPEPRQVKVFPLLVEEDRAFGPVDAESAQCRPGQCSGDDDEQGAEQPEVSHD